MDFSRTTRLMEHGLGALSWIKISTASILLLIWSLWFFTIRIPLFEHSSDGRVEVISNEHRVDAPASGRIIVNRLNLGVPVRKGTLLVQLDDSVTRLEREEQMAERAALEAEAHAVERERVLLTEKSSIKRKEALAALDEIDAEKKKLQPQLSFSQTQAERYQELAEKQSVPELEVLQRTTEASTLEKKRTELEFSASRLLWQTRGVSKDIETTVEHIKNRALIIRKRMAVVDATVARLTQQIELHAIRAPVDGEIGAIATVNEGVWLEKGAWIAKVIPHRDLRVVAYFDPRSVVGRVKPGQPARIKLPAFPWTQYGSIRARVDHIGTALERKHNRVELALGQNWPKSIPMQHGLPADVEILVERITPAKLVLRTVGSLLTDAGNSPTVQTE